jgi:RNA polymerase sigma-70 factor (ECF subfamily)
MLSSNGRSPSDDELLAGVAGGDMNCLEELLRRYRSVAYRVAYRLLSHEADALDAVQEGFLKVLTNLQRFRGESTFKSWLLRVVSNAALDIGRQRQLTESRFSSPLSLTEQDWIDPSPAPESDLDRSDLRQQLDHAVSSLPEHQRLVFVLHADGGLSYREIADMLGISIGTVMSRLFYARQRLKTLLADQVLR